MQPNTWPPTAAQNTSILTGTPAAGWARGSGVVTQGRVQGTDSVLLQPACPSPLQPVLGPFCDCQGNIFDSICRRLLVTVGGPGPPQGHCARHPATCSAPEPGWEAPCNASTWTRPSPQLPLHPEEVPGQQPGPRHWEGARQGEGCPGLQEGGGGAQRQGGRPHSPAAPPGSPESANPSHTLGCGEASGNMEGLGFVPKLLWRDPGMKYKHRKHRPVRHRHWQQYGGRIWTCVES